MGDDYRLLLNKHIELADKAEETWSKTAGSFVDPLSAEKLLKHFTHSHKHLEPGLFGGHKEAERKRLGFLCADERDFGVALIKLSFDSSKAPGHRDILGSVIGLGIDRKYLGDICLFHDCAYIFCDQSVQDLIFNNLTDAGRAKVTPSPAAPDDMPPIFTDSSTLSFTLDSPRLDAVIAKAFSISRDEAKSRILAGKAFVDWTLTTNHALHLNPGENVTLRGSGRFRVDDITDKKDKIVINITM